MRREPWNRPVLIAQVRRDIWRYLTAAARMEPEELLVEAGAILGLSFGELRRLATIHFVLSPEVKLLLESMHSLARRLASTTVREEETSMEVVRGPIVWGPTLSVQAAVGVRQAYVTAPARRAYDTPENRTLVAALNAIVTVGAQTGWLHLPEKHLAAEVRDRVGKAQHWLQTRALSSVPITPLPPRTLTRVASGRSSRRYRPAVDVLRAHREMVRRLDTAAIRRAVEQDALVATADDTLFELLCAFAIERALKRLAWKTTFPGLVKAGKFLDATDGFRKLSVYYQGVPPLLNAEPRYQAVQEAHGMVPGVLRPDLVLGIHEGGSTRWVLGEVKGGVRSPAQSARQALLDLMAYRRNYARSLDSSTPPYGLGIAWGAELRPMPNNEILLCTPDKIEDALRRILAITDPPPKG